MTQVRAVLPPLPREHPIPLCARWAAPQSRALPQLPAQYYLGKDLQAMLRCDPPLAPPHRCRQWSIDRLDTTFFAQLATDLFRSANNTRKTVRLTSIKYHKQSERIEGQTYLVKQVTARQEANIVIMNEIR